MKIPHTLSILTCTPYLDPRMIFHARKDSMDLCKIPWIFAKRRGKPKWKRRKGRAYEKSRKSANTNIWIPPPPLASTIALMWLFSASYSKSTTDRKLTQFNRNYYFIARHLEIYVYNDALVGEPRTGGANIPSDRAVITPRRIFSPPLIHFRPGSSAAARNAQS